MKIKYFKSSNLIRSKETTSVIYSFKQKQSHRQPDAELTHCGKNIEGKS